MTGCCSRSIVVTILLTRAVAVGHIQELTIDDLRTKADQGDAEAEYSLGLRYADGQGVQQDYAQARPFFERAAIKGHAAAEYQLGLFYAGGLGGPQDYALAREWYSRQPDRPIRPRNTILACYRKRA